MQDWWHSRTIWTDNIVSKPSFGAQQCWVYAGIERALWFDDVFESVELIALGLDACQKMSAWSARIERVNPSGFCQQSAQVDRERPDVRRRRRARDGDAADASEPCTVAVGARMECEEERCFASRERGL